MYGVHVPKLKGKMAEKGYTATSFSAAIGVTRPTLDKYMKHPEKIPYSILVKMVDLLCDSFSEAMEVFFTQKLS